MKWGNHYKEVGLGKKHKQSDGSRKAKSWEGYFGMKPKAYPRDNPSLHRKTELTFMGRFNHVGL